MDTTTGTSHANKDAATRQGLKMIRPIDIFLAEPREIDEETVAGLAETLERDVSFLHPITIRDEGAAGFRLISGYQRLEAHKRHYGEQKHIEASVYHPDTPDALIPILRIEENLLRKKLSAAESEAQTLELTAACKKLNGGKLTTELPVSEADETSGGRGRKAATAKMADMLGLRKAAIQKRIKAASVAIREKIDLDRDTPEELERKAEKRRHAKPEVERYAKPKIERSAAIGEKIDLVRDTPEDMERKAARRRHAEPTAAIGEKIDTPKKLERKRRHAEPKVEPPKGRKPAPRGEVQDPTRSAKPQPAETESQIEVARKAFDALPGKDQLRFIHDACVRVGLDPLLMAPPAAFGLVDEEPERAVDQPTEDALATDDVPMDPQAEPPASFGLPDEDPEVALDPSAEASPATDDAAVVSEAEQQDDAADPGGEDLQNAGDEPPAAFGPGHKDSEVAPATEDAAVAQPEQGDDGADLGAENVQDAGDDVPEAADPELGVTKCAYCTDPFSSNDPPEVMDGRLYHRNKCVGWAKQMTIAAE